MNEVPSDILLAKIKGSTPQSKEGKRSDLVKQLFQTLCLAYAAGKYLKMKSDMVGFFYGGEVIMPNIFGFCNNYGKSW